MGGGQFLWGTDSWTQSYRQDMIDRAVELWTSSEGRVLTQINFHLCPPTAKFRDRGCAWDDIDGNSTHHVNLPWLGDAILTEGSEENTIWLHDLDTMAGFLSQLQRKGVPVLWRPFHESNGGWFWWGQQPRFKDMWMQVFDRFTQKHGLHNLVWVYGASNHFPMAPYYPGHDMVDVLGQDIYASQMGFTAASYKDLVESAKGKPVALTEIGLAPDADVLSSQNHSFSLMWGGFEKGTNTPEGLRALYNSPRAVNQDHPWLSKGMLMI